MAQADARHRPGARPVPARRQTILDLGEQERVEQVVLEPQDHLGVRRLSGEPAVALAHHRQRRVLGERGSVGRRRLGGRPVARGEVAGADAGELVGVEAGRDRAVVQDLAPDEHLGGVDAGGIGQLGHDRVAVRDVQRTIRNAGHGRTIRPAGASHGRDGAAGRTPDCAGM